LNVKTNPNGLNHYTAPNYDSLQSINKFDETDLFAERNNEISFSVIAKKIILSKDTCGDRLILKNGEELRVKITEITDFNIIFKRCDNINGPDYTLNKERVAIIYYANGIKEIVEPPVYEKTKVDPRTIKKVYPDETLIAIFMPLLLGVIGMCISLYFGRKAIRLIEKNPEIYKGLNITKFMVTFDIISIATLALIVLIVIGMANTPQMLGYVVLTLLAYLIAVIVAAIYYATR